MDFPVPIRKRNRLDSYDYTQNGAYFITICTLHKKCIFGSVRKGADGPVMGCNDVGRIVEQSIRRIPAHYPGVEVVRSRVMPNHVHLLLTFATGRDNPALSTVINQFKGAVTKELGRPVWQKGYYDRVVRNTEEFRKIGEYIEYSPAKWSEDDYFSPDLDP